jgi:hypothetical protein
MKSEEGQEVKRMKKAQGGRDLRALGAKLGWVKPEEPVKIYGEGGIAHANIGSYFGDPYS